MLRIAHPLVTSFGSMVSSPSSSSLSYWSPSSIFVCCPQLLPQRACVPCRLLSPSRRMIQELRKNTRYQKKEIETGVPDQLAQKVRVLSPSWKRSAFVCSQNRRLRKKRARR